MLRILSVFPEALDLNGDAQNALVLSRRAQWSGHESEIVTVDIGQESPIETPGVIVVGSGSESAMASVRDGLRLLEPAMRAWVSAGIPLVAVGTGWELLGEMVELPGGRVLEGLGIFSARSTPSARVSDDLVVDSEAGRLIGFENHARSIAIGTSSPLGRVVYGVGNSIVSGADGERAEGERVENAIGTHLHGPVLAKNPGLADLVLRAALGDAYDSGSVNATRVDDIARAARNQIAARLGLEVDSSP